MTPVWYYPFRTSRAARDVRFAGYADGAPFLSADGVPCVRLVRMAAAYGAWRGAPRTTVPAAPLEFIFRRG